MQLEYPKSGGVLDFCGQICDVVQEQGDLRAMIYM